MFVNVNRIMKNCLLLYKVTPQVSKILFLVYLTNYSLECAGAEVKHLKRGEDGEMHATGMGSRWLMRIMGGLRRTRDPDGICIQRDSRQLNPVNN